MAPAPGEWEPPSRKRRRRGAMSPTTTSRMAVGLLGLLLAASGLTGCGAGQPAGPAAATTASTVDAERCPVTLPRDVGPPGVSPRDFFGWASSYGNGRLWVGGLWPSGVINAGPEYVAKDGSVGMKFGWWRAAPGKLGITGRRLDAPPRRHGGSPLTGTATPASRPAAWTSRPRAAGRSRERCPRPGSRSSPWWSRSGHSLMCGPRGARAARNVGQDVSPDCRLVLAFGWWVDRLP